MSPRLEVADASALVLKHPETLRKALRVKELHGTQNGKKGRWLIQPECLEAWLAGELCVHKASPVTDISEFRESRTTA